MVVELIHEPTQEVIMIKRTANAEWYGDLAQGKGTMGIGSGAFEGEYSFASRFENGQGTNSEELIGAAYAGCYSMALSAALQQAGYKPDRISTVARVQINNNADGDYRISSIDLETHGNVPDIDEAAFLKNAQAAYRNCPVSQALNSDITSLKAILD